MVNLKKGDRVIVSGKYDFYSNGLGVIEDVGLSRYGVRLYNGRYVAAEFKNVKHYKEDSVKVKVGDRVKVVGYSGLYKGHDHYGTTGLVIRIYGNGNLDMQTDKGFVRCVHSGDFEIIASEPPQKITQNGYEYSLVGPVKPDWLVDGAWVVRKDNGCKHQVVLNKNGLLVLTMPGTDATILPNHHIYDQYRPHTSSDWKWGDWALYRGKRVFVMGSDGDSVKISHPRLSVAGFACEWISFQDLTPTF